MFHAQLRRTQHVAGRMQRQLHAVVADALTISQGLQVDLGTQARAQDAAPGAAAR
jgi:hypothetical protein